MPDAFNANDDTDQALMGKLAATGVKEVQLHEPALVMWESSKNLADMFKKAYFGDKVSGNTTPSRETSAYPSGSSPRFT